MLDETNAAVVNEPVARRNARRLIGIESGGIALEVHGAVFCEPNGRCQGIGFSFRCPLLGRGEPATLLTMPSMIFFWKRKKMIKTEEIVQHEFAGVRNGKSVSSLGGEHPG